MRILSSVPAGRAWLAWALAGGALHALAFSQATGALWPGWLVEGLPWLGALLQLIGLGCLLRAVHRPAPRPMRQAAWTGWLFGTVWLAGSVWWLFISMHRYGGLPAPLAALAVAALAGALSLYLAGALAAYAALRTGRWWADAALFAACWLLADLARASWFTGFPWAAAGYAHVDGPLAAWAPWVGVHGMGAMAALCVASVGAAVSPAWPWRQRLGAVVAAGALLMLPQALPASFTTPAGALSVTLLQGNVPQDEKFDPTRLPAAVDWHVQALLQARTDLVVAAETAIPLLPAQMPPELWQRLVDHFDRGSTTALFGLPLGDYDNGYTNSAIGLGPHGLAYRYDKHHLVPFGEFIPTGFRWFVALMNIPLGDFDRGPVVAPSLPLGPQRIGPNICYEDLFGQELAARYARGGDAPTVLANVSNIGWFGHTVAVSQHLQISRMRSLELQRPMLRATNTGATVAIDHTGTVRAALAPFTRGTLDTTVEGREGLTPYARWAGRWGLGPLWVFGVVVLMGAWRLSVRSER